MKTEANATGPYIQNAITYSYHGFIDGTYFHTVQATNITKATALLSDIADRTLGNHGYVLRVKKMIR